MKQRLSANNFFNQTCLARLSEQALPSIAGGRSLACCIIEDRNEA